MREGINPCCVAQQGDSSRGEVRGRILLPPGSADARAARSCAYRLGGLGVNWAFKAYKRACMMAKHSARLDYESTNIYRERSLRVQRLDRGQTRGEEDISARERAQSSFVVTVSCI